MGTAHIVEFYGFPATGKSSIAALVEESAVAAHVPVEVAVHPSVTKRVRASLKLLVRSPGVFGSLALGLWRTKQRSAPRLLSLLLNGAFASDAWVERRDVRPMLLDQGVFQLVLSASLTSHISADECVRALDAWVARTVSNHGRVVTLACDPQILQERLRTRTDGRAKLQSVPTLWPRALDADALIRDRVNGSAALCTSLADGIDAQDSVAAQVFTLLSAGVNL